MGNERKITIINNLEVEGVTLNVNPGAGQPDTLKKGEDRSYSLPSENDCLRISVKANTGISVPACKLVIPAGVDFQFDPSLSGMKNVSESSEYRNSHGNAGEEKPFLSLTVPQHVQPWEMTLKLKEHAFWYGGDPVSVEPPISGPDLSPDYKKFLNDPAIKNSKPLKDFIKEVEGLTPGVPLPKEEIIDQAIDLIGQVYVHLHQKSSMYAANPLQRLKLLKKRISKLNGQINPELDDMSFHREMISIFTELRDLHTIYIPPYPYRDKIAFLPLLIEEFYEDEKRKYIISKVVEENDEYGKSFRRRFIITHWNGIPIDTAVTMNGELNGGSNEDARHARGLERMTIRPLSLCLIPTESWVDITCLDEEVEETHNFRFKWQISDWPKMQNNDLSCIEIMRKYSESDKNITSKKDKIEAQKNLEVGTETDEIFHDWGVDVESETVRRAKKNLHSPRSSSDNEEKSENKDWKIEPALFKREPSEEMPDFFAYGTTKKNNYGYIRIYTFDVNNADEFVDKFQEIALELEKKDGAKEGLIIDIRGNGGGSIIAAEELLQTLAYSMKKRNERMSFQLIDSPMTRKICAGHNNLERWKNSLTDPARSDSGFSKALHLNHKLNAEEEPKVIPFSKFVLITDAICYSAAEVFAAGFKDNEIGKILGVHKRTGGGGANTWPYYFLKKCLKGDNVGKTNQVAAPPLGGCDFWIAVCRGIRAGINQGILLEDFGVESDCTYAMTKDDLLNQNAGLIREAEKILAGESECKNGQPVRIEGSVKL